MTRAALLNLFCLIVITIASTAAEAQCLLGREFAASGGAGTGIDLVRIDTNGSENAGNEIGRFWQSDNSLFGNNFAGNCASNDPGGTFGEWWAPGTLAERRRIRGVITGTNCTANTCPDGEVTFVVEDPGPDDTNAYFIGFRVDESTTPESGNRVWDLSRVDPNPSPSVLLLQPFPVPVVGNLNRAGNLVFVDLLLPDVADNVHAVTTPEIPLPPSTIVKSYDLYTTQGDDPGRSVTDWTLVESVPYLDGPAQGTFQFDCPATGFPFRIALGVTFEGGAGPGVVSALLGESVSIDCDQAVAHAGQDRVVECATATGTEVLLDGVGSLNATSYLWEAPGVVFDDPTSSQPTGSFPPGVTIVTLTVSDAETIDTDTVEVTVADTTPPEIACAVSIGDDDESGDDEGADLIVIDLAADDLCGDAAAVGAIDLGWTQVAVHDGMPVQVRCVPTGSECGVFGGCDGLVQVDAHGAVLSGLATDAAGNTATCSIQLCSPATGGGFSETHATAATAPGGLRHVTQQAGARDDGDSDTPSSHQRTPPVRKPRTGARSPSRRDD